jgi:hypothetical protein
MGGGSLVKAIEQPLSIDDDDDGGIRGAWENPKCVGGGEWGSGFLGIMNSVQKQSDSV